MKKGTKYFKLSLILYAVILGLIVVGTLAWFIFDRTAEVAPQDEVDILVGKNVDICIDGGTWGNSVEVVRDRDLPDVSMTPDGTFIFPKSLDDDDNLLYGDKGKGVYLDVTEEDGYFVKVPLKVRANRALSVYLDASSFVRGLSIDPEKNEKTTTTKDAIAGAARVAFFEVKDVENEKIKELKTVWVPNERYQLQTQSDGSALVYLDGTPETTYKYLNVVDGTIANEASSTINWDSSLLSIGSDKLATRLNPDTKDESVYVNQAKALLTFESAGVKELWVYIWIEGTDRESRTALAGGYISYNITLVGVEEKEPSNIDISMVTYDKGAFYYNGENVSNEILYSIDGEKWTAYAENNPYAEQIKFIRTEETKTRRLGEIRPFTVNSTPAT